MARKKIEPVAARPDPAEAPITIEELRRLEKEEKEQEEIGEWLVDFQSRFTDQPAKIQIEKFEDGEWGICRKYPLAAYDHEAVREEYGGGKYRAILIGPDGRYVEGGRNYFRFAQALKPREPERQTNPLENPVVVMMLESMKNQQMQMLELTKSMIAAGGGSSGKGGLAEVITAMKGLQDLTPKENPMSAFKDTLNMMKLVKEVTGDGDSKGGLLSEIRQFLEIYPTIKEQLAALKPAAPAPPPGLVEPPAERSRPVLDPFAAKIVELVPMFVAAAKKAEPIEKWGEILLDKTDVEIMPLLLPVLKKQYGALVKDEDDVYDILLRLGKEPAEREKIFTEIPPLAPYREWVGRVIDEALRLAQTEPDDPRNVVVDAVTGNGKSPIEGVEV